MSGKLTGKRVKEIANNLIVIKTVLGTIRL